MHYIVDTHALIWYFDDDAKLGAAARQVLDDPAASLLIPVIVLVELIYAGRKKGASTNLQRHLMELRLARNITVLPLEEADLVHVDLSLNIHDAIIVACALAYSARTGETVQVITKDDHIAACGLVDCVW